ncbi:hypothetical protein SPE_1105 [Spiroplasma eriocheiris CCTCC M 207170]|nr:hypothetical protein SPE_1105 [Spiroplasma eriocheiris CCTCC M 207170]
MKPKDNKQMEVTYDKKSVTKFKQWKFKRQIIIGFFIAVILVFLTCLGVLIYQNVIIKQHQPSPQVINNSPPSPQPSRNDDSYELTLASYQFNDTIVFQHNDYFFLNLSVKKIFLAQWINVFPTINNEDSYLVFDCSNEHYGLSKIITIVHYTLANIIINSWRIKI